MTKVHEVYFDLYFRKRITGHKKIDEYKKWELGKSKTVYKSLDQFFLEELSIDKNKLNQIRSDFEEFKNLYDKYFYEDRKEMFDNHEAFLAWYKKQMNKSNEIPCGYCGITEPKLKLIVKNRGGKLTLNKKSKRSRGTMEIERVNSNKGYTNDNCIMACPLCNNAKSNLISERDWRDYFVESMKKYYEKELN